jgi:hypothetical protein
LVIKALDNKLEEALITIDNLENRSRRRNLRLLHLPEKSEAGYSKEAYLAKILSSLLSIPLKENDIEIAHRIGPLVKNVPRPRTVIFKLHHLQKKLSIVETAGSIVLEPTDLSGVRLRISEDISVRNPVIHYDLPCIYRVTTSIYLLITSGNYPVIHYDLPCMYRVNT